MQKYLCGIISNLFFFAAISAQVGCFVNAKLTNLNPLGNLENPSEVSPLLMDPANVQLKYVYANDGEIIWDAGVDPATTYRVSLSSSANPSASCTSYIVSSGPDIKIDFSSLNSDTTYFYRVCAVVGDRVSAGISGTIKTLKSISRASAYSGFANWNEYLKNSGTRLYNAVTPTACVNTDYGFNTCMNGGLLHKLTVLGVSDCSRIKVFDHLDVFQWACATSGVDAIIYSTDFKEFKGMRDLISNNEFIKNSVIIKIDGQSAYASPLEKWWSNVIEPLPSSSGSTVNLVNSGQSYGKIFTVSGTQTATAYSVNEDKISIVVLKGGLLIKDTANTTPLISAAVSSKFLYFEGQFNGNNQSTQVMLFPQSYHSRIHNSEISNATADLVQLNLSRSFKVTDFSLHHGLYGLNGSSTAQNASLVYNGNISNMTGVGLRYLIDTSIQKIIFSSMTGGRGAISYSYGSIVTNVTIANSSASNAIYDFSGSANLYHNILALNVGSTSIYNYQSYGPVYSQIMVALATGAELLNSSTNAPIKFTNNLVLQSSTECTMSGNPGADPGLVDGTCANSGLSDAVLTVATFDFTKIFAGKVQTQDSKNSSNTLGSKLVSSITDWSNFDNFYRAWGNDGSTFPASDNRAPCTSGTCRIWDFRLKADSANMAFNSTNTVTVKNAAFVAGGACPAATKVMSFLDVNSVSHTFLVNAIEIPRDGIGNDNGLCESGEACLYTPNFGAYQGEGDYLSAGTCNYTDTTVTGVKLYAYPTNGI